MSNPIYVLRGPDLKRLGVRERQDRGCRTLDRARAASSELANEAVAGRAR